MPPTRSLVMYWNTTEATQADLRARSTVGMLGDRKLLSYFVVQNTCVRSTGDLALSSSPRFR